MPLNLTFLDVGNPLGWKEGFELWPGGPVGYLEHQFLLAEALVRQGHKVTIYGQTVTPHTVLGVRCLPLPLFVPGDGTLFFWGRYARASWAPFQGGEGDFFALVDRLRDHNVLAFGYKPLLPVPRGGFPPDWRWLAFSRWHERFLWESGIPTAQLVNVGHPLHSWWSYDATLPRSSRPLCLYASSPDRGLEALVRYWPRIRRRVSGAEGVVTYRQVGELGPGLQGLGRVSAAEMKRLFHAAWLLLYPATEDVETFCYSVAKARLAGCVPVVTPYGALMETAGADFTVAPDEFVDRVCDYLLSPALCDASSEAAREYPTQSPDAFAERLVELWTSSLTHRR